MASVFLSKPATWQQSKRLLDASWAAEGARFGSRERHDAFYTYLLTPRSGRWAYVSSGKTGTTSTLALLFRLEFGVENSALVADPSDMNRDAAMHRAVNAGVFRSLHARDDIDSLSGYLANTLRIATVRHPTDRAWSAFRYLCRSQDLRHMQFAAARIRLCALTGFDWDSHARTREGFERFLDFVAIELGEDSALLPDNHWRPQWLDIRPDLFRPDVLGRLEQPDALIAALVDRLGRAPGDDGAIRRGDLNGDPGAMRDRPGWMTAPSVVTRLAHVYGTDYEAFDYDP